MSDKNLIKQFEKDFKNKKLLKDVKTVSKALGSICPLNKRKKKING